VITDPVGCHVRGCPGYVPPKDEEDPPPTIPNDDGNTCKGKECGDDEGDGSTIVTPIVTPPSTTTPTPIIPLPTISSTGTPPSSFTQNQSTQVSSTSTPGPDWGKVAEGVAIIFVVDVLIVAPIVIGLTALAPELEVAMVLTEAWSWPLVAGVVAANVYGFDLIREGITGQSEP
jgi:hypothetical protein